MFGFAFAFLFAPYRGRYNFFCKIIFSANFFPRKTNALRARVCMHNALTPTPCHHVHACPLARLLALPPSAVPFPPLKICHTFFSEKIFPPIFFGSECFIYNRGEVKIIIYIGGYNTGLVQRLCPAPTPAPTDAPRPPQVAASIC